MQEIHLQFFLNDKFKDIRIPANTTVLEYLRNIAGLTGTKLGCGEGDCGSCTIAIGELIGDNMVYKAVNSCLIPVAKMHRKHIVTVEGISDGKNLHPIQTAILENHATQCGFCTPGITMSLFGYLSNAENPNGEDMRLALEGNLCRCTGYKSVKLAADFTIDHFKDKDFEFPEYFEDVKQRLQKLVETGTAAVSDTYLIPANRKQLVDFLKQSDNFKIISGGTDLFVLRNLKNLKYEKLMDVSAVEEFRAIDFHDGKISIGGSVTLSEIRENGYVKDKFPVLSHAIELMASKQIRNIATIAGNVANASPVADSVPVMLSAGAVLHLLSPDGERKISLNDFYISYKKTALKENEVIEKIVISVNEDKRFSFEKSSKRKAVDISTVNSAIAVEVENEKVKDIKIAYGGIAPVPTRLNKVEKYLSGKTLNEKVISEAAVLAADSVKPITDMRGSELYRKTLVKNHLIKHFHKLFPEII
jgi:xanthine dehydrogenase small subunit